MPDGWGRKMADYAATEKEKIIGDVQKQSIIGGIAIAGLLVVELLGLEENTIVDHIHVYLQTLAYVSVLWFLCVPQDYHIGSTGIIRF